MKKFFAALAILLFISVKAHAEITYTVQKGDTLFKIAQKFNVSVRDIRENNNIAKSRKLKIGQTLIVKQTGPKTYIVKKGDTISKIAKKFNIDSVELKDINLLETDDLKAGQKLLLEPESEAEIEKIQNAENLAEEIKQLSKSDEILNMNIKERLILFSKKLLNIPYRFGGNSIMGIDCSAFVKKVYGLIGIDLPRSARLQFKEGEPIDKESLTIGDLVFFRTYASFPSHVGIYLGNNLFIHASSKDRKVSISSLTTPYYVKRFIGAKRFIQDEENVEEIKTEKTDGG